MKRWIRRTALGAVLLVVGAGAAFVVAAQLGERKLDRKIEVARRSFDAALQRVPAGEPHRHE